MTGLSANEKHRLIAKTYGLSFMQRQDALDLAETEEFGGDVVLAIAYLGDRGRASQMFASGQRHAIEAARERAAVIRAKFPDLDTAFPIRQPRHGATGGEAGAATGAKSRGWFGWLRR